MPDRFDLMSPSDLIAALRISKEYCTVVNPSTLADPDHDRLDRSRPWVKNIIEILNTWDTQEVIDSTAIETPPNPTEASSDVGHALSLYANTIDQLVESLADATSWDQTRPYSPGTHISFADIARHATRIVQTTSVDQRWIWQANGA